MEFCNRKGVECECLTDHSVCNSDNCHRNLPDVKNQINYFVIGFNEVNLIRIGRVDILGGNIIKEVIYGIYDIPFATPCETLEDAQELIKKLITTEDIWWHSNTIIDIYEDIDKTKLQIFEVGLLRKRG